MASHLNIRIKRIPAIVILSIICAADLSANVVSNATWTTNEIGQLMRLLATNDTPSLCEKRIAFHDSMCRGATNEQIMFFTEPNNISATPIDVLVHIWRASPDRDKIIHGYVASVATTYTNLFVSSTYYDTMERRRGFMANAWFKMLKIEPFWLPAIYTGLRQGYSLADLSNIGVSALETYPSASLEVRHILRLRPLPQEIGDTAGLDRLLGNTLTVLTERRNSTEWESYYHVSGPRLETSLLRHAGHTNESLQVYQSLLVSNCMNVASYNGLSLLYEDMHDLTKAEEIVLEGLPKFPAKNSPLLVTAAKHAVRRGDIVKAREYLNRCLSASPQYPPALMLLAEIEASQGNRNAALETCADALAYSYGWGEEYPVRVKTVLQTLVKQKQKEGQ